MDLKIPSKLSQSLTTPQTVSPCAGHWASCCLTRPQGTALHLLDHTASLSGLPLTVVLLPLLFSFQQGWQTWCLTISTGAYGHGDPLKDWGREHLSPTLLTPGELTRLRPLGHMSVLLCSGSYNSFPGQHLKTENCLLLHLTDAQCLGQYSNFTELAFETFKVWRQSLWIHPVNLINSCSIMYSFNTCLLNTFCVPVIWLCSRAT